MRRRTALAFATLLATLAPACALLLGIEELPTGDDAGADAGDAGPDHANHDDARPDDASDAHDAVDASDAVDAEDANDASDDANDASDADDGSATDSGDSGVAPGPCDCPVTQEWSKAFASTGDVTVAGVAVGPNGNIIVAGSVSGDLEVRGSILPGGASHDVFVIALDPCGEPLWSRRFGDSMEQSALAIAVDPAAAPYPNAILLTGTHAGTLSFGGTASTLVATTGARAFVARLDPMTGDGIQAMGAGADPLKSYRGTSIVTSADGTAHWAGTEADDTGIFVRRLDPSMSVTHEITPSCAQCGPLVAPTPAGVMLAGWFQGTLDLVPGGGGVITSFGVDVLAATLSPLTGSFDDTARKAFGDNQPQRASGVATDAAGNLFLAGDLGGTLQLSAGHKITSTGGIDAFVAKLDGSLTPVWIAGFGNGATDQTATAIALGSRLAVVGDFVGGITVGNVLLSNGGRDAFLVALDPTNGGVQAAMSFGGSGDDHAAGVALDASGSAVVAGVTGAPAFFGCGTLGGPGKSVFVAKRAIP